MSTKQYMLTGIYESTKNILLIAGGIFALGDIVALDPDSSTNNEVIACTATGTPYGVAAVDVTVAGIEYYEPRGFYAHTHKVGEEVGIYVCGGILKHENTAKADAAVYGQLAYIDATSPGKLTEVADSGVLVGIFESDFDSDGVVRFKSYL